ncbi:MAG: hydantoinase B/oxoprolinase family protein [Gammaproteobacteria bacterium]|nr:hydantoinase B/oxoprolinase family protein [Gammaproteobacteria bacterium]
MTPTTNHETSWQFWVDRGGTFTDIVARTPNGKLLIHKLLSENPECYEDAAVYGIRELLGLGAQDNIASGMIGAIKMGTTVATNALLERKGDPTLLMITAGFGDLLRIGYQNRPRIFDLDIRLPTQLYEMVVEVPERMAADGTIALPLDEAAARAGLAAASAQGIRSVAIALMHGYKFPGHEKRVAELAREAGFTQISVSHQVSPLIKLVSRGDTTVVDAYLSPILSRYVKRLSRALDAGQGGCRSLQFMQSNGGLTDAGLFQGKDAILSGPAGGVVGMTRTAEAAGFHRLIGFDMGGTSTDVCHYAGEYERTFETEIAGVRMRAPMMSIHTVAAGGGSIVVYQDRRFQVGPESAGANPGPAAYRRGGPLTVTDCNVLLGKIQPEHFPNVFGTSGNEPLDIETVRKKFTELSQEISRDTREAPLAIEDIAEGFLRIAVENMANAIKKISVQRGYDVTAYTLNCFGGAGGQHACLVADALGMEKIFIHPFAGVLSAFGMGLADIRALRERQFEKPLKHVDAAEAVLNALDGEVFAEVLSQGIEPGDISIERRAHLRYAGSHRSLPVLFGTPSEMHQAFELAHKARYGFVPKYGQLIIELLSSEAIGTTTERQSGQTPVVRRGSARSNQQRQRMYSGGQWLDVLLVDREVLVPFEQIDGPAIITERTGTNVVEPGWRAESDATGNLIMSRVVPRDKREAIGTDVDPVMLEVFNNLFMSVAEQMGATLANTAYSVNIKERLDFSCALFDPQGGLVANAPHVPVHLGSMGESVRTILKLNEGAICPGDVFMMNNPFNGGTHLPDVTVITPVFDESGLRIDFVVASRGHHADIGGKTPGSSPPDSCHIEEEGIVIDNFKLVAAGVLQEDSARRLLGSGRYPCRNIDQNMADLTAQIAANETGARELRKMIRHFGRPVVAAYMGHVQDNAEASVRRVIGVLQDGHFSYSLDNGAKIEVTIRIDHPGREAEIDFSGTSPQDPGNYNAPLAVCRAAVLYVFRTLVGNDIPMNEGCLKPIRLIIPEGTLINPSYPAAVIAGNTEVSQAITDALYGALGVLAGSQGTMNNLVYGNDRYQNYETICGGAGAGSSFHGASAVHTHMTNTRMTDPEVLESRFPVRVDAFAIRHDSGGAGTFHGGDGVVRRLRFLEPATMTVLSSHRCTRPFGVGSGAPGKAGINRVIRTNGTVENLRGNDSREMSPGDVFLMKTPGGGGFGLA